MGSWEHLKEDYQDIRTIEDLKLTSHGLGVAFGKAAQGFSTCFEMPEQFSHRQDFEMTAKAQSRLDRLHTR